MFRRRRGLAPFSLRRLRQRPAPARPARIAQRKVSYSLETLPALHNRNRRLLLNPLMPPLPHHRRVLRWLMPVKPRKHASKRTRLTCKSVGATTAILKRVPKMR